LKVGRPPKYKDEETRKTSRRIQNRINQRRCRLRKKLKESIVPFVTNPVDMDRTYKEETVSHFKKFEFNYLFTGTIDPNYYERKILNPYCDGSLKIRNSSVSKKVETKIGIQSLRRYTKKFIESLFLKGLIKRWFVVFEMDRDYKYHVHILFGTDKLKKGFKEYSENYWKLGNSKILSINTEQDKVNTLNYCVKEFKPSSYNINDLNKMDNWFFDGEFHL
jgi:hypothetical protein